VARENIPEVIWWRMVMDTLSLRYEFFAMFPMFSAFELAELSASELAGGFETMRRWQREARVFSVRDGDREYFPKFQFDEAGRPLRIIAELLAILRKHKARSDWDNAMWFMGPNGWLDGPCPVDLLLTNPALVMDAAEQEVLPHIE
jgi:hypothetical protein